MNSKIYWNPVCDNSIAEIFKLKCTDFNYRIVSWSILIDLLYYMFCFKDIYRKWTMWLKKSDILLFFITSTTMYIIYSNQFHWRNKVLFEVKNLLQQSTKIMNLNTISIIISYEVLIAMKLSTTSEKKKLFFFHMLLDFSILRESSECSHSFNCSL